MEAALMTRGFANTSIDLPSAGHIEQRLEEAMLAWANLGDPETGSHAERVGRHAARLAQLAGMSPREAAVVGRASRLHDFGKIGVPQRLLRLPRALNESERRQIEAHAEIGFQLMSGTGIALFDRAAVIALTHHERWDGRGYPNRLCGEETPIEGRITAIVDAFDALTSPRVYRPALRRVEAIELMERERGGQFDPRLLDLFFDDLAFSALS